MKKTFCLRFYLLLISFSLTASGYAQTNDRNKTLSELILKLEQDPGNKKLQKSLIKLYDDTQQMHLQNIKDFQNENAHPDYKQVLNEYTILQHMFERLEQVPAASQLISAPNYADAIAAIKQLGASDNYQQGISFLSGKGRANKAKAYYAFKNVLQFDNDYKDSRSKMQEAYAGSHLNILINSIKDSVANIENLYTADENNDRINVKFQQDITRDLIEKYTGKYNATFYNSTSNIAGDMQPDRKVTITIIDLKLPAPTISISNKDVTITQPGGSSTNAATYGTIDTEVESYTATGKINVMVTDANSGKLLVSSQIKIFYKWNKSKQVGLGDRATVSYIGYDLSLNQPEKFSMTPHEEILNMVYEKSYGDIEKVITDSISK